MKSVKYEWARAYLNGVISRWKWVDIFQTRIEQLREQMITYGGSDMGERVQTSPSGDALEKKVIAFIEKTNKLTMALYDKIDEANERQAEAEMRIMSLKVGKCQDLLIDHYLMRKSFEQIKEEYYYSDINTVYKLHERALEYFTEVAIANGWVTF